MVQNTIFKGAMLLTPEELSALLLTVWRNQNRLTPEANAALSQLSFAFLSAETDIASSIRLFIRAHYAEPLTLQTVAAHFFISPCHLSHLLARSGDSFSVCLQNARLQAAKELLLQSRLPVNVIAARAGFSTAGQFRRVFGRTVGCTPCAFRVQNACSLTSEHVSSMIGTE